MGRALIVTASLLSVVGGGCRSRGPCPEGAVADEARAERIRELLFGTELGRSLQAGTDRDDGPICFAEHGGTMKASGPVVLARAVDDRENAARLGHLLHHAVHGAPFPAQPDPARPCEAIVDAALMAEARAHGLELRLRRALGVETPTHPLGFADEFWATADAARDDVVFAYFVAHPEGDGTLPPFASSFAERCRRSRERPAGR